MNMLDQMTRLVEGMRRHGIDRLSYQDKAFGLCIRLAPLSGDASTQRFGAMQPEPPVTHRALAPDMGVFLRCHPQEGTPAVADGQWVTAGTVIGFVRQGEILKGVTAPADGYCGIWLIEEGAVVGYRDPVLVIGG
ncbi:hypothetical protein ACMAUO_15690 [Gluconacetobacter sp. Hr-1-5]|uniref:hypothetical protein n=1 Tax=Gluconacetobacter sp. Hr-1-5 TaxID=3395370 RepID=UPI003B517A88